jgi:hypothetical protein
MNTPDIRSPRCLLPPRHLRWRKSGAHKSAAYKSGAHKSAAYKSAASRPPRPAD